MAHLDQVLGGAHRKRLNWLARPGQARPGGGAWPGLLPIFFLNFDHVCDRIASFSHGNVGLSVFTMSNQSRLDGPELFGTMNPTESVHEAMPRNYHFSNFFHFLKGF